MQDRDLNKTALDKIGRKLIRGCRPASGEVESILADPALYNRVLARIAAGGTVETTRSRSIAFGFGIAAAAVAAVIVLIGGYVVINRPMVQVMPVSTFQARIPEPVPEPARPDDPAKREFRKLRSGRASLRSPRIGTDPIAPRKRQRKMAERPVTNSEFYAISYAGDPHEPSSDGRVVRVDMSRSSLFALGINIPLENDHEAIKTDLLIGADGMPRGIRVVQ